MDKVIWNVYSVKIGLLKALQKDIGKYFDTDKRQKCLFPFLVENT